jgi:hypothetical protein
MKNLIIITMLISLNSCKLETKEQKLKRVEKNTCDLAYNYVSECARVHKGVAVAPFKLCSKEYAEKLLEKSCLELMKGLVRQ